MSQCRRCGATVPRGHGHCDACASFADGFDSGANYADDFEGTTEAEAIAYAHKFGDEIFEQYDEDKELPPEAQKIFLRGLIAGLKAHAKANKAIQDALDREGLD
jgi:hypothetical protein